MLKATESKNSGPPEYSIESDDDWAKWFETLLLEGLAEVEVGEVCWQNTEKEMLLYMIWNITNLITLSGK